MLGYFVVIAIWSLLGFNGQPLKQVSPTKEVGCHSAKVTTGASPGRINIAMKCTSGEKNQPFIVSITRYPLSGNEPPGIRAFRHRPPLVGSGGRFARCRRAGSEVNCEGRARKQVRMLPVIHVRPATRCRMGVLITSSELTGCSGNVCPVAYVIGTLFKGLPKGC